MKKNFLVCTALVALVLCGCASQNSFIVADMDPFDLGKADIGVNKYMSSKLQPAKADVSYDPRGDFVIVKFKSQAMTWNQYWNAVARQQFITQLDKYKQAFAAKALDQGLKPYRSHAAYGTADIDVHWGVAQASVVMSHAGVCSVELGYEFKGINPFFTVHQGPVQDRLDHSSDREVKSLGIVMYFTREQADALAAFFNKDNLINALEANGASSDDLKAAAANKKGKHKERLVPVDTY